MPVVNEDPQCVCTHTSIYSKLTLDRHVANTEQRLITMSASLCTQTGLHNLTIQVQNIESTSIDTISWHQQQFIIQFRAQFNYNVNNLSPLSISTSVLIEFWIWSEAKPMWCYDWWLPVKTGFNQLQLALVSPIIAVLLLKEVKIRSDVIPCPLKFQTFVHGQLPATTKIQLVT